MEHLEAGIHRQLEVQVGRHIAPAAHAVPAFLARWETHYTAPREDGLDVIALACAHHRLGWIHPFADGNGRTMWLHTRAGLMSMDYAPCLWSPNRAFARTKCRYQPFTDSAQKSA